EGTKELSETGGGSSLQEEEEEELPDGRLGAVCVRLAACVALLRSQEASDLEEALRQVFFLEPEGLFAGLEEDWQFLLSVRWAWLLQE
ncbi:unnamed protein product, partial [Polarella glacialis]